MLHKQFTILVLLTMMAACPIGCWGTPPDRPTQLLDGQWKFRFANDDVGMREQWFGSAEGFARRITVPGCWDAQGLGSRTDKMNHNAVGVGWYSRTIDVPREWHGKHVWLKVEGAHRRATAWINGKMAVQNDYYPLSFSADITSLLKSTGLQTIVMAVDSRRNPSIDPLMGSYDTVDFMDVSWGGITGSISLEATGDTWINDAFVLPDPLHKRIEVKTAISGNQSQSIPLILTYAVNRLGGADKPLAKGMTKMRSHFSVSLPSAPLWTPEQPNLLELDLTLLRNKKVLDRRRITFGLRRLETRGHDFLLNGDLFFLRGYGDDWNFPVSLIGEPNVAAWKRYLQFRKSFGFNGVRHHSCMPPEAYLQAADEVGMFVQPEMPIAYMPFFEEATRNGSLDAYRKTWEGYILRMRNHPCVFAWCMGNELPESFSLAKELYQRAKDLDPTRPVIDTDGLFTLNDRPTLDYVCYQFAESVLPWDVTIKKYVMDHPFDKPVIVHEMANFSVLPDPTDIPRYTGGVRPFWLEEMAASVKRQGLAKHLPNMLIASRRLQASLLKLNMEAARLSGNVRGYYQWLFRDYWAQSTGFVNQFDELRAITPAMATRFNHSVMLLWDRDRVSYHAGETLKLKFWLSDFRPSRAPDIAEIRIVVGQTSVTAKLDAKKNQRGLIGPITVELKVPPLAQPAQLRLKASANGTENEWSLWVFPPVNRTVNNSLIITPWISPAILKKLEDGASVLLTAPESLFPTVNATFKTAWWHGDDSDHVYGNMILDHPAMRSFSAEGYGDLQMYRMMNDRQVVALDDVPGSIDPIVWSLDVPWRMRRLAYLFEARVGKGRLLVSSFNFARSIRNNDPAAAWLYMQLANYASSSEFKPLKEIPAEWLNERVASVQSLDISDASEGFGSFVESTEGLKPWHSYRENDVEFYPVRQTDGRQRLTWITGRAKTNSTASNQTSFAWAGGMGWESEPDGGKFTILVNGKYSLDFPFSVQNGTWRSNDGRLSLSYIMRRRAGPDSFGIFILSAPTDIIRQDGTLELTVTAPAGNSKRWYGINTYTDVTTEDR